MKVLRKEMFEKLKAEARTESEKVPQAFCRKREAIYHWNLINSIKAASKEEEITFKEGQCVLLVYTESYNRGTKKWPDVISIVSTKSGEIVRMSPKRIYFSDTNYLDIRRILAFVAE